jgi:quercetin dioxygenase-like cupin family protein
VKIQDLPFTTIAWDSVAETTHAGDSGEARWRTFEGGNLRVRMVEYSKGYVANHWCSRGHVLLVLEGEIETELQDGRRVVLKAGTSYQVADDVMPHRSRTATGAKLFIVD